MWLISVRLPNKQFIELKSKMDGFRVYLRRFLGLVDVTGKIHAS